MYLSVCMPICLPASLSVTVRKSADMNIVWSDFGYADVLTLLVSVVQLVFIQNHHQTLK